MHNNIYIEYVAIGLMLLFIGIFILSYHIYLSINYGWDYIIVGYSRLSGKTATQIKSAIYFDFFIILCGILISLYGFYKQYLSFE
jgi:hypothetical protein